MGLDMYFNAKRYLSEFIDTDKEIQTKVTEIAKGFNTEWTNSFHPYRDRRKDYCENIDGRLGFICTTNVVWTGMLDVDHIDGDSSNNADENLQTLCRCCHAFKTNVNEDYKTPGRKALGIKY